MSLTKGDKIIITFDKNDKNVIETEYIKTTDDNVILTKDGYSLFWNGRSWFLNSNDNNNANIPVTIKIIKKPTLQELAKIETNPGFSDSTFTDLEILISTPIKDFTSLCLLNQNMYKLCNNPSFYNRLYKERFITHLSFIFGKEKDQVISLFNKVLKTPITFLNIIPDIGVLSEEDIANCTISNWKDIYNAFNILYNIMSKSELKSDFTLEKLLHRVSLFAKHTSAHFKKRKERNYVDEKSQDEKIFNSVYFTKLLILLDYLTNELDPTQNLLGTTRYIFELCEEQYNVPQVLFALYADRKISNLVTLSFTFLLHHFMSISKFVRDIYDFQKLFTIFRQLAQRKHANGDIINELTEKYVQYYFLDAIHYANMEVYSYLKDQFPDTTVEDIGEIYPSLRKRAIKFVLVHENLSDDEKIDTLNSFLEQFPVTSYTFSAFYSMLSKELFLWLKEKKFTVTSNVLLGFAEDDNFEMIQFLMNPPFNLVPTFNVCSQMKLFSDAMIELLGCRNFTTKGFEIQEYDVEIMEKLSKDFQITVEEFEEFIKASPSLQKQYVKAIRDKKSAEEYIEYRKEYLKEQNLLQFGNEELPKINDKVSITYSEVTFLTSIVNINEDATFITLLMITDDGDEEDLTSLQWLTGEETWVLPDDSIPENVVFHY